MAVSAVVGAAAAWTVIEGTGFAFNVTVREGSGPDTCQLRRAEVVTIAEEGSGRCFFYAYPSEAKARKYFGSIFWRPFSRIMFQSVDGLLWREMETGGPSLPHNSIRRAARMLALNNKIFIRRGTVGFESIHFDGHDRAFVSFESDLCREWRLDDGSPMPPRKFFEDAEFDPDNLRFTGILNWAPKSFNGDQRWDYEMIFDSAYLRIVKGSISHYTPGFTDKGAPGQTVLFGTHEDSDFSTVVYKRWLFDDADEDTVAPATSTCSDAQWPTARDVAGEASSPDQSGDRSSSVCASAHAA